MTDEYGWLWPGFTALELEWRLMELPNPEKLVLHINSPGGCVCEGLSIFNKLMDLRKAGSIIEVINEGICYSIATFIAMAASPGHLIAREASLWCVHKPYFPNPSGGTADDLRKAADELDSNEAILSGAYVQRTGKSLEDVQAELRLDKIINATEAKAAGWVDVLVPSLQNQTAPTAQAMAAKPLAFYRPNTNPLNKEMTKDEQKSLASEIVSGLATAWKTMFPGAKNDKTGEEGAVNSSAELADDTLIYFEGELAVDTAVFIDEAMTELAADGTYELKDGRSITTIGGKVTEITEASEDTAAALAAKDQEIAELTAQIETLTGAVALVPTLQTTISSLEAKVAEIKAFVPGGGDSSPKPKQTYANYDQGKKAAHPLDAAAANIKNRKK